VSIASPRYAVVDRLPRPWAERLLRWESLLVLLLIAVVIVNSLLSPYFLDPYNLFDATFNFSEKAMLALSMALLILVRDIDLSVASIIALASVGMGMAAEAGAGVALLVPIGLVVGLAAGAFNGALVTGIGLPSIVVTIGTMSLFRGIAYVILGDRAYTSYPPGFAVLGQGYAWGMVPYELMVFLLLAAVFGFGLHRTVVGRRLFAMGANPLAARFSGIGVDRHRFWLFVLNGTMAGLVAVLLTSRIGSTRPNIAVGWELEVVTMVVLGGVSIAGGSGTILGVVLAVLVLGFVTFGLALVNVPGIVMSVFTGCLLIAAIAVPILVRRLTRKA
jgi:rhamnose transport system permease protein